MSKGSSTRVQFPQEAGTVPIKALDASLAYSMLEKEAQDEGKEPFSVLLSRSKKPICNQNLMLVVEHSITYTII